MVEILLVDDKSEISGYLKEYLKGLIQMEIRIISEDEIDLNHFFSTSPDLIFYPFSLSGKVNLSRLENVCKGIRKQKPGSGLFLYFENMKKMVLLDISYGVFSINPGNDNSHQKLLNSIREVTSRSKLERSLRDDYDHNNRVINRMPLACIEVEKGYIIRVNPAFLELTGKEEPDIIGRTPETFFVFENEVGPGILKARDNKEKYLKCQITGYNGITIPCRLYFDSHNHFGSDDGIWFIENRIEFQCLRDKLRETEYECREQLYLSETLIVRIQPDGTITFANPAAIRCFGYDNDGLNGMNISVLFPSGIMPDSNDYTDFLSDVADESSASVHIFEHLSRDKKRLWIAWTTKGLYSTSGDLSGIICIGTDMTEHGSDGKETVSTRIWRDRIIEDTDILPDVFDAVLQACMEIGREGREGKAVGTSFLVGDDACVLENSRQLILNPFFGHPIESRNIISSDVREMLKEYAMLDGAFVVSGNGILQAAGRYITVDTSSISLPKGMGTRHSSTAALTSITAAIGFVVSESGGKVSIMKKGAILKVIA